MITCLINYQLTIISPMFNDKKNLRNHFEIHFLSLKFTWSKFTSEFHLIKIHFENSQYTFWGLLSDQTSLKDLFFSLKIHI